MKRNLFSSLIVLSFVLVGCVKVAPKPSDAISSVRIGGVTLMVTVADSIDEQARGLAGVTNLTWDEGMLFMFPEKRVQTFWMKGMVIPIDIIWIDDTRIVGFEKNVQPQQAVADSELTVYSSQGSVNRVLETRAGFVDRFDIAVGDIVELR